MKTKEQTKEMPEVNIVLKADEVHLLIMATDCGFLNFNNVQNVISQVFSNKEGEKSTGELLKKITDVRNKVIEQCNTSLKKQEEEKNKEPKIITL